MVQHYIRKTLPALTAYSQMDLGEAVRRVKEDEPCRTVARLVSIPLRTLRDHVAGSRKLRDRLVMCLVARGGVDYCTYCHIW